MDFNSYFTDKTDVKGLQNALEAVFNIDFVSDRAVELQGLKEHYTGLGGKATDFNRLAKAYQQERDEFDKPVQAQFAGVTRFFGSPYPDLKCGKWIADDKGVRVPQEMNIKTASRYPITWVKSLKNVNSSTYRVVLAFKKRGQWYEVTTDKSTIVDKSKICSLAAYDFPVTTETNKYLVEYLADLEFYNSNEIELVRSTSKLGWQEGRTAEFYPYSKNLGSDLVFDGEQNFSDQFMALLPEGDADKWLDIAREVRKSGRLEPLFLMAASFASPLLAVLGVQSFCVNLWGNTEGGKTVTAMLAASIWADPRQGKFITDFGSTPVMYEVYQDFLNSFPLIVDDSATVKDKYKFSMSDFVYQRCKEKGKGRSDKNLAVHDNKTWRQVIITNGEQPTVNEDMQGGAINRTLDLPCGQTAIYSDPKKVVDTILANHAHAGAQFMLAVLNMDREAVKGIFQKHVEVVEKLDGMAKQTNSLAAVLTADELAERYVFKDGITIDPKAAAQVLTDKDFVSEDMRCYNYLTDLLSVYHDRFYPSEEGGYKGEIWGCVDGGYMVIIRTVLKTLCKQAGYSDRRFLEWAKAQGLVLCDAKNNPTRARRFGSSSPRCVFLRLPGDENEEDYDDGVPF